MLRDTRLLTGCGLLCCAAIFAGCVENEAPLYDPYDPPLVAVALSPDASAPIPRDATFRLSFNTYPNPGLLTYYNVFALSSGGLRTSGVSEYVMVDKALVFRPTRAMIPDLYWTLAWEPESLESVTGQPLAVGATTGVTFLVADEGSPPVEEAPLPTWAEVAPILAPCDGCHADPEWRLPPMRYEALVGQPSPQRPSRLLVRPYDTPSSYLMHKLLEDFPIREGEAQPPSWSGATPLTREELGVIERWIRAGAPR